MRLNIKNFTAPLLAISVLAFFTASCNKSATPNFGQVNTPNNFDQSLQDQFPPQTNNPNIDFGNIGTNPGDLDNPVDFGDLGTADQQGLANLLQELQLTNPQNEADLPPELAQKLADALSGNGDAADPDAAFEIIQLGGQVLTACLEGVDDYVPRPGEPLQGTYDGSCGGAKMPLTVTGVYQKIFRRRASSSNPDANNDGNFGGTSTSDTQNLGFANGLGLGDVKFKVVLEGSNGIMNVNQNGIGSITVGKYKGKASDVAANGKPAPYAELTRPDEGSGKHVVKGCTGTWVLSSAKSTNPIPEKYVEAMKIVGQCYRKALVLFTPGFQRLFKNMDPQLKRLIQLRLIGIQ